MTSDVLNPEAALGQARNLIEGEAIRKVDIYFLSYDTRTRVRVSPETLPKIASKKLTILVDERPELLVALRSAINSTKVRPLNEAPNLHWGAHFYDDAGKRILAIYLDGSYITGTGRRGYIGNLPAGFNGALIRWFEANFL